MRLLWTFVLAFTLSVSFFGYAQAQENEIDPFYQTNAVSQEGFSLNYSEEEVAGLRYDALMTFWKKKQAGLWEKMTADPFIINASAYTASADECGNDKGITASGAKIAENQTLACPPEYPFGTKIEIETMGIYTCEDRGGAIKNNHFDIYMKTKSEAFTFGRKNLLAKVLLD